MKILFTAVLFLLGLSGPVLAEGELPKPGDLISGSYNVYEDGLVSKRLLRKIPLPEGNWIVARAEANTSKNNPYTRVTYAPMLMHEMVLAKVDKSNKLEAAIYLRTNVEEHAYKWDTEFCKDENNNFIYSNNHGTSLYVQRCTSIRASTYLQGSTAGQNAVREFYNSKGIKFDSNAIWVQNTEYDDNGNYVRFDTYYFPSADGLENPSIGNMPTSPWFKTNYITDPKKVKFIGGLEKWANENSALLNKFFYKTDAPVEQLKLYRFN